MTQKLAWKLRGHTKYQGLPITIEQRKGDARSGVSPDGKKWRTVMQNPYGYIKGTKGRDGEEIDVFLGPDKQAPNAHVVHQHKPDGTGHDEDKVILGVPDEAAAKKLYLANYDAKGPTMLGPISVIPMDELKRKLEEKGHHPKLAYNGRAMELLEPEERQELSRGFRAVLQKFSSAVAFTSLSALKQEPAAQKPVVKGAAIDKLGSMADELEALGGATAGQLEALRKHAAVSEDRARRSLDRLQTLEQNKPTMGQAARYGALGGVGGGVIGAVGNAIEHGGPLKGTSVKAKGLNLAASAAKGALGGGAIPLMRNQLDRRAEVGTLKGYLKEQQKTAAKLPPATRKTLLAGGILAATLGANYLAYRGLDSAAAESGANDKNLLSKIVAHSPYKIFKSKEMDNAGMVLDTGSKEELKEISEAFGIKLKGVLPGEPFIVMNPTYKSPGILAHEIGHGEFHKNPVGRFLQRHGDTIKNLGVVSGAAIGVVAGAGSKDSRLKVLKSLSVGLPVITSLIADAPEAVASHKAVKQLKEHGASEEQLTRAKKQLLRGGLTYLTSTGLHAIPGLLGQAYGHSA